MIKGCGTLEQYRINKLKKKYALHDKDWILTELKYGIGRYHEPAKFTFRMRNRDNG